MKLNMKKAFTLVEMLIVIVIIGILAAALIPRLTGTQARARDTARKADLQQLGTALATWSLDYGTYPVSWWNSKTSFNNTAIPESNTLTGSVGGNPVQDRFGNLVFQWILREIPVEGNTPTLPYSYMYFNSWSVYALRALSEGWGANANFISWVTIWGTTTPIVSPVSINQRLCTTVTQSGSNLYNTGWVCYTAINSKWARYIVAN